LRCFKKAHKLVVICYSSQGKLIYFPCGHPGTQSPFLNFLFCLFFAPTPWVSLPGIEPVPPVLAARSLNPWSTGAVLQSPFFYGSTRHQALAVCCIQPVHGETMKAPLQYSCLENPTDGGAWEAAVHGVATSRIRLSDFNFTFHFHALEKEMATHSSILAWRIPGTGEPGGLPSMGSHRVGHD